MVMFSVFFSSVYTITPAVDRIRSRDRVTTNCCVVYAADRSTTVASDEGSEFFQAVLLFSFAFSPFTSEAVLGNCILKQQFHMK